jgi:hypothetical protein
MVDNSSLSSYHPNSFSVPSLNRRHTVQNRTLWLLLRSSKYNYKVENSDAGRCCRLNRMTHTWADTISHVLVSISYLTSHLPGIKRVERLDDQSDRLESPDLETAPLD